MSNVSTDPEQAANPFAQFGGSFAVQPGPRAYLGSGVAGADEPLPVQQSPDASTASPESESADL